MSSSPIGDDLPTRALNGSLVDRAHDELHRLITDGELVEGERIVIDRFAREFGTSLIPVREALARLHAEGLVLFERNKGYRVAPVPTAETLVQLFDARLVIETGAAELALNRSNSAALDELRDINRMIERVPYGTTYEGFSDFVRLNEAFHVGIVALAGNAPLAEAYRKLGFHQQITRPTFGSGPGDVKRLAGEHDAILDALENRDPTAIRQTISLHIASGREHFQLLGVQPAGEAVNGRPISADPASGRPPGRSAGSRVRRRAP